MVDADEIAISHLQRRKIEGRVLIPFIEALRDKFGENATREVVDEAICKLAAEDGARWAATYGQTTASLRIVAQELWAGSGSMDVQVIDESEDHLDFNVTRCQYAEFYKELGLSDLGFHVHCKRDHAMVVGFNRELELSRSQTIMEGAKCCDFRFHKRSVVGPAIGELGLAGIGRTTHSNPDHLPCLQIQRRSSPPYPEADADGD